MKNLKKSRHLDFDKNPVNIEYLEHANGMNYIEITETTPDENGKKKQARLSKAQFDTLVNGLLQFQKNFQEALNQEFNALTDAEKQHITQQYQAGASAKELGESLKTTEALIKRVLQSEGIKNLKEGLKGESKITLV